MSESARVERPDRLVIACAIAALLLVVPLVGVQVVILGGVVLSENGFAAVVPRLQDIDYDGNREIVVGCADDGCPVCDWHGSGLVRYGTVTAVTCGPWYAE